VGRSTDHDSTKRARDATPRDRARHFGTREAVPRTTSNDLSRVMPDVMCGTCAEAPAAVARVRAVRYEVRTRAMRRGFERRGREAPMGWVRVGARVAARARAGVDARAGRSMRVNSLHRPRANPTRTAMRGDGKARIISAARGAGLPPHNEPWTDRGDYFERTGKRRSAAVDDRRRNASD
jgi:hypothetical protein